MSPKVFFYVQHLLGVGHVYRATRIARAMAAEGFEVHLVWGGTEVPGFDFSGINLHRLTPVRSGDASFSGLLHADGREFSETDKETRAGELLSLFDTVSPDILITEAYPFGRRQMRFELKPLLERASTSNNRPMVVSSIRDIMQEGRKENRVRESCELVNDYFDLVMVHGDRKLIAIEETLQGTGHFQDKIRYTGLVTPDPEFAEIPDDQKCDVLVSAGGGAFGKALLDCAIEARLLCGPLKENWIVIAGSELADEAFAELQMRAGDGIKILRHVADLKSVMHQCKVSVSHAGYNTVADILRAGCSSVLFPHTGGRETEQLRRAQIMQERKISVLLEPEKLTPQNLASRILEASDQAPPASNLNLDGAKQTAVMLREEFEQFTSRNSLSGGLA